MTGQARNWRAALIEAYPGLFHPSAGSPALPECGEGWQDLLQRACARIRTAVAVDGGWFRATQIKEKYGTLRFYWDGNLSAEADTRVEDAIDLAEARSACTCETCGEEGRLYRKGGWLMTRCALHAEGHPVESEPRFENVQVMERIVGKGRRVLARRYNRVTDSFVDVDPQSLGIEE
ncbi:conserved hypothetical protein [Nitrobacter hamburgensis X14]|uniref:Uncharacterized protein n=1 Tax=Nitrobacter hamburgensis (strain DSM 10229 / NCIMB 13809 / X14) TaxID=323097 RepID=Q1QNL6_NITHX|nr:hypothetical protein [Nitrobacter hamburgensis]ABE62181.1 conserved hypothetical protein [Nitrobacter hamburgensis X14]